MARSNGQSRVPLIDERSVLRDTRFRRALKEVAERQGRSFAEVERYAFTKER